MYHVLVGNREVGRTGYIGPYNWCIHMILSNRISCLRLILSVYYMKVYSIRSRAMNCASDAVNVVPTTGYHIGTLCSNFIQNTLERLGDAGEHGCVAKGEHAGFGLTKFLYKVKKVCKVICLEGDDKFLIVKAK